MSGDTDKVNLRRKFKDEARNRKKEGTPEKKRKRPKAQGRTKSKGAKKAFKLKIKKKYRTEKLISKT